MDLNHPVQLTLQTYIHNLKTKACFIYFPGQGWTIAPQYDPNIALVRLNELPPHIRNDYLTTHRIVEAAKGDRPAAWTPEVAVNNIRNEHRRRLEVLYASEWITKHNREKLPVLLLADGLKVTEEVCRTWSVRRVERYRVLCRHELLLYQAFAMGIKPKEWEHRRYANDLAAVYPVQFGQHARGDLSGTNESYKEDLNSDEFWPGLVEGGQGQMGSRGVDHNARLISPNFRESFQLPDREKRVLDIRKPEE